MKRIFTVALFLVAAISLSAQSYINVGQFNLRYDTKKDVPRGDGWAARSQHVFDLINYEGWDIFGVQEVLVNQVNDLKQNLAGYEYVGSGRTDGATKGEYAPIFYRKSRIKCLESGQFWLSQTPEVAGSKGWDANIPRICTWGRFEDKTTKWKFWFFNLHMDHRGVEARRESAKLVLARIKELCGDEPYILTGDFNSDQTSEAYATITESGLLKDSYHLAKHVMAETGSMNFFNTAFKTDARIDHIFVSPQFKVHKYGVLTHSYWNPIELSEEAQEQIKQGKEGVVQHERKVISDHHPVTAYVELPLMRSPQDFAQYGRYEQKNKEVTKKPKVVFIGDSLTDNWYKFHSEFFTKNNYLGRGISGQVTTQMLARFQADVVKHSPETVVILAGTNDIAMNKGYISIDHILENIISMAQIAKANKIKVVLCSVLPAEKFRWSWEVTPEQAVSSINELNEKIRAYAMANGCKYADYYSVMDDGKGGLKKEYQKDAVHPNLEGYYVMEEVIQKILK